MYRSRLNRGRMNGTEDNRARERAKTVLIFLLIAALVGGAVYCVPAVTYREEARSFFLQRMISECGEAVTYASTLSRTAGSSSTDTLARIRSRVYAMEVINSLSTGLDGSSGSIISQEWFTELNDQLDEYTTLLLTGMSTGEQASSLQTSLSTLYSQLGTLQ